MVSRRPVRTPRTHNQIGNARERAPATLIPTVQAQSVRRLAWAKPWIPNVWMVRYTDSPQMLFMLSM